MIWTNWSLETWLMGMQTYRAVLANSVAVSQEVKCRVNTPPSNTTPKYICKRTEICSHKNVHTDVSSIIIQSSVKVKTVLMSTK